MLQFSIGLSALQSAQQALQVVGNNVANASTPGYHRQTVQMQALSPMVVNGQAFGRGVELSGVQRVVDQQIETALTAQGTTNSYTDTLQTTLSQLQSLIPTDSSSISSQLGTLFNDLQTASSQLNTGASRQVVIADATSIAQQFNSLSNSMSTMRNGLDQSIQGSVDKLNPLLQQIANLNTQIAAQENAGVVPNDLLDERDQLVNNVAQQIPIQTQDSGQGEITVLQSGVPLVIGGEYRQLVVNQDKSGNISVSVDKSTQPLTLDGGELGAYLDARSTELPKYQDMLDTLARQVSAAFDGIQSTGFSVGGGYTQVLGQRAANSVDVPLNSAGLSFPVQAGTLVIGVTNTTTGQRTLTQVSIDPATQSLTDVANAIGGAIPNLQAFVSKQAGTLSLMADPGYAIDFAGGVSSAPTTSFSAGTTVTATTGGSFTGATNDVYKFTFLSSGTVGVTPGLQAQVTDQAGDILGTIDVGQGYSAGQPITGPNGVTLSLSAGNVTAGDSLSTLVSGQPDSSGILTALGLNTFFSGTDASSLRVNSQLARNPDLLATSQTGQPGDTSNLQRFVGLQNAKLMNNGSQTLIQNFTQFVSTLGSQVSALNEQASTNQVLTRQLQNQQQTASGVNVNDEMMSLIQYQQMFQSASQYISAINSMYEQLFQSL